MTNFRSSQKTCRIIKSKIWKFNSIILIKEIHLPELVIGETVNGDALFTAFSFSLFEVSTSLECTECAEGALYIVISLLASTILTSLALSFEGLSSLSGKKIVPGHSFSPHSSAKLSRQLLKQVG